MSVIVYYDVGYYSIDFIIVYYDVGYYSIDFIRVIIMSVWLAANNCLPVDTDYRIGIVEVEIDITSDHVMVTISY